MDLGLSGKVAVVTGGSGGIGSAVASAFANEGTAVAVVYFQHRDKADEVVDGIRSRGQQAIAVQADVRDAKHVSRLFAEVSDQLGYIDVLVNCAGASAFHPLTEFSEGDWDVVMDTNLKGTFLCCQAALPYFKMQGRGDVINISSLAASTGSFESGAYAASKAGVNLLTLSLALELAPANIRINAIAPGRIATPFRRTTSGPYFDFMLEQTPMQRLGTPEEVANLTVFLASRASGFITGETIYITGGLHTVYLKHVTPDSHRPSSPKP